MKCKDCAAFKHAGGLRADRGQCHRHAPGVQPIDNTQPIPRASFVWPIVSDDDFCLEGVERKA